MFDSYRNESVYVKDWMDMVRTSFMYMGYEVTSVCNKFKYYRKIYIWKYLKSIKNERLSIKWYECFPIHHSLELRIHISKILII